MKQQLIDNYERHDRRSGQKVLIAYQKQISIKIPANRKGYRRNRKG